MRKHALDVISSLKKDRISGLPISSLVKKYSLPKTTVWHHIKDVKMSVSAQRIARSSQGGSREKSRLEWCRAESESTKLVSDIKQDEAWPILFAALYWAEGTKRSGFVFTNTDENMIRVFLHLLRKYLHIHNNDLDVLIRTRTPKDPMVCKKYWSQVTNLSEKEIKINHNDKQNKSKSLYGICRITVRKGGFNLKLAHCLIRRVTAKMLDVPLP